MRVESVASVERVDSVIVTVFDTITITKTITIRENEAGDTLRISTVTDRERVRTMAGVRSKREDVNVRKDTVYVEREAEKTVAAAGPDTEIDADGNLKHRTSAISLLRWVVALVVAVIVLIIVIRVAIRLR